MKGSQPSLVKFLKYEKRRNPQEMYEREYGIFIGPYTDMSGKQGAAIGTVGKITGFPLWGADGRIHVTQYSVDTGSIGISVSITAESRKRAVLNLIAAMRTLAPDIRWLYPDEEVD